MPGATTQHVIALIHYLAYLYGARKSVLLLSFFGKGQLSEPQMTPSVAPQPPVQPPVAMEPEAPSLLKALKFRYPLRQYQKEIIELIKLKLERGERQLHIVAPPGAGKTIIGLQIITKLEQPSLIVCPTTTIQAQWGQKLELFTPKNQTIDLSDILGTHEDRPLKPITLLTYQVLSTTSNEHEYLSKLAHDQWIKELNSGSVRSQGEAELRILELMQNNRKAYDKELSRHISQLRRKLSDIIDPKEILHKNALALLQAFRRQGFKTVIFDECHHLTDYWAAVMKHVVAQLDEPLVIGLTGTPPEGKSSTQATRYMSLVGEINYQVPTPALVREGGLAPFQDLVFFTEPTQEERQFLATQHEEFHYLINELLSASPPLLFNWINERLQQDSPKRESYLSKRPDLQAAMTRFGWTYKLELPLTISLSESLRQAPMVDDWMLILEDFALNLLKVSASSENHALYERICSAIAKLGYGLTERGLRKQASPVDRVLAFSRSKSAAVTRILSCEYGNLGERLRAAVITDFEKMSATAVKTAKGVLTPESGGAVAVLRELLNQPIGNFVNPCLVTGSLLLVDRRIAERFIQAAQEYMRAEGSPLVPIARQSTEAQEEPYVEITANGAGWEARSYVAMATALLELGITKCLIGTRGIFGEGWDCQSLNTLVDLTTTTTAMSVKQLRGRSIRLKVDDPLGARKVANNWDVVCIAPELEKGLNDYQRFVRKHEGFFGVSDDGQIECGVGHVHGSFSDLTPAEIFQQYQEFNDDMLSRALNRERIYDLWKVGHAYKNTVITCVEVSSLRKLALTPPNLKLDMTYAEHAASMRANLIGLWAEYAGLSLLSAALGWMALAQNGLPQIAALAPFLGTATLGAISYRRLYRRLRSETCRPNTQESSLIHMSMALLSALKQIKALPRHIGPESLKVSQRSDGSFRVFLDDVDQQYSDYFTRTLKELLAPITNQPYLLPKYEFFFPRHKKSAGKTSTAEKIVEDEQPTIISTASLANLKDATDADFKDEAAFFSAYLKGLAQPRVAAYHAVPSALARSDKGRSAFEAAWNKYVSAGSIVETEDKPELLRKYFGIGPALAQRLLWE